MCCGSDNQQVQQQSVTMTPEGKQYADYALKTIKAGVDEASQPYAQYPHARVAGFTPDQMAAFTGTRANQGAWQPGLTAAYDYTQTAGQTMPEFAIGDYMNPFTQNVTDIAKRESIRQDDIARQSRDAGAVTAGAFGGSRHALVEAESQRNLDQRLNDIQMTGDMAAYQSALAQINADRTAALGAGAQSARLGQLESGLGYTDAAALSDIGGAQQAQEQRHLDTAYQDFTQQRDWDKNQLTFLNSLIRGSSPTAYGSTTTTTGPGTNTMAQIGGLGLTAAGMIGGTGGFGSNGWLTNLLFRKGGLVKGYAKGGAVKRFQNGGLASISMPELLLLQRQYMRGGDGRLPSINTEIERRRGVVNPALTPGKPGTGLSSLIERTRGLGAKRESELAEILGEDFGQDRDLEGIRRHPALPAPRIAPTIYEGPPPAGSHWNPEMNRTPVVATGGLEATPQAEESIDPNLPIPTRASEQDVDSHMFAGDPSATATPEPTATPGKRAGGPGWDSAAVAGLRMMAAKPGENFLQAAGAGGLEAVKYMQQNRNLSNDERRTDLTERDLKRREETDRAEDKYRTRKQELDEKLAANKISQSQYENDFYAARSEYYRSAKTDEARARLEAAELRREQAAEKQRDKVNNDAASFYRGRTSKIDDPDASLLMDPKERSAARRTAENEVILAYPKSSLAREFLLRQYGEARSNIMSAKKDKDGSDMTEEKRQKYLDELERQHKDRLRD